MVAPELPKIEGLKIEGELGHGAHSVVYRGVQNGAACAIKLPRVTARWTQWIYREAVALARVKHPLLPAVFEVGEVDTLPYLIMELIEGPTLAERLEGKGMSEDVAINIARQLASVLTAVHDAGLVHRDVKPRNIVVERKTGRGVSGETLKLVDFGFATPMERVGSGTAGTAAYAAPEQLEPPGNVDARTDLYAVGRVLFEGLTGQSLATRTTPGPWGADARRELVALGVSTGLAGVVGGLLERDPNKRYPNGQAVTNDLACLDRGVPILGPSAYEQRSIPKTHLVGRDAERTAILAPCNDLVRRGGAVILLRGGRGSGKSRLLQAVCAEASEKGPTLLVSCRQDDPPLSTLRRLLEQYCDQYVKDVQSSAADVLRAAIDNLAPVARLIAPQRMMRILQSTSSSSSTSSGANIGATIGAGTTSTAEAPAADALAEGAAQILLRLAGSVGAMVFVIDDAQWMDPASCDALLRMAHRVGEAPVLLVLASRSQALAGSVERLSTARPQRLIDVELSPLGEDHVRELIASHLGERDPRTVDPLLVSRIHAMAGGTPLGVLEVLGAFLDAGTLRPHNRAWFFDPSRIDRVVLPTGARVLLGRRLAELPIATRRVLEAASIIGTSFDEALVANVLELTVEDLGYGLHAARRAGLLEVESIGRHRFIHDSLRELLVDDMADNERRRLHQRVAEILVAQDTTSFEDLCAAALHFAEGESQKDPARVYRVARAAGDAALARFDNETALRFFEQSRVAADAASLRLDAPFHRGVGEAHLRHGAMEESLAAFTRALDVANDNPTRASILGRISWVHQTRAESDRAWETLGRAFETLGQRMPTETVASAVKTSSRLARGRLGRLLSRPNRHSQSQVDLLCDLHYQNARLGLEYAKPARLIQSSLAAVELSEHGGSPATRARAKAFYALVATALGRKEAGAREVAAAKEIARKNGDVATFALCVQFESVVVGWAGNLDESLRLSSECVDIHGPWLELIEYCQDVTTADLIHAIRGTAGVAWPWMERAVERLRRARTRPAVAEFLIHRARATLAASGHVVKDDPWLLNQLASVSPRDAGNGFHRLLSWGPRARYYLESGELGADFESLVREFEAEGHNPKSVHMAVGEYYMTVAHARIHQALALPAAERAHRLPALRKAAADLRAAAKIPLTKAHQIVVEGYVAWFEGDLVKAKKRFAVAETLANENSCPWVLYAVARAHAHILRAAGKEAAARDQARVAQVFAREHGAVTRLRWIEEEFGLSNADQSTRRVSNRSASSSSSRTNRQLSTLLHVARASRRDLKTEQQAAAILDELITCLHAGRGAIQFQPEVAVSAVMVERHRGSAASASVGPESPRGILLTAVHRSAVAWPPADPLAITSARNEHPFDPTRVLAVPLFLYEKPVGALCLEREAHDPAFVADDRALLTLLSHQVPIALEIARLLAEREQVQASLQHAKKMEAMGALAGGLAHDFNNMLAAMRVALNAAQERAALDEELSVELDIISEATTRAAQLTNQLLTFSRHQPMPAAVHDVNQLISMLEPMLRRVVGSKVEITTNLSPAVDAVEVDQNGFDQALVNLLINARDAMPQGGRLSISTRNVILNDTAAQRTNVAPGEYVEIEIADTGEGMSQETLARIFEPFFTTKPVGKGSGLGLAMVYAFTRNSGGGIEVLTEIGAGTQFRLFLKRVQRTRAGVAPRASSLRVASASASTAAAPGVVVVSPSSGIKLDGPDTILVVDDDDLVRRSISKILERNGYRVVSVSGSTEALNVAREQGSRIGLVILDILMPGLTGPELGRRLGALNLSAKMLFVSGFSPESIPLEQAQVAADMLLQKPFSQTALLERVRQLMQREVSS